MAAGGSGRSTSFIPAVPAAWSVTTIAFICDTFLLHQPRPDRAGSVTNTLRNQMGYIKGL
ncbi:hypothetical protein GCM10027053_01010 [Intrasporangium mesophilum]